MAVPAPWWLMVGAGALAAFALAHARMFAASLAGLALASTLAAGAWSALDQPVPVGGYRGEVELASDPVPSVAGGVRVDARVDGRLVDMSAWGSAAGWLRPRLRGERVEIVATIRRGADLPGWVRARGVVGRATISQVSQPAPADGATRVANELRRLIERGAASMTRDERALYVGLVYGDDRDHSPLMADDFAASGLTHLVAVSGQNVAFLLALLAPLLRRCQSPVRFATVIATIGLFATMTRFEPSVLRASAMAATAALGVLVGTRTPPVRLLAWAVAGLILYEPLLVHRVAFQLSVAASAGILWWSGPVARAIPGPRWIIDAVAVTAAAQLAVAPILIWRFGGLAVASLPANVAAAPVAGPIMMWGMTAGLVGSIGPDWLGWAIHLPTRLGLRWLMAVAGLGARLPLGDLGLVHVVAIAGCGRLALRAGNALTRRLGAGVVVTILAVPLVLNSGPSPGATLLDGGSMLWVGGTGAPTVVELDPDGDPEQILAELRSHRVDSVDLVVVRRATYRIAQTIGWITQRVGPTPVWSPEPTLGHGEHVPTEGDAIRLGSAVVTVAYEGADRLSLQPRRSADADADSAGPGG